MVLVLVLTLVFLVSLVGSERKAVACSAENTAPDERSSNTGCTSKGTEVISELLKKSKSLIVVVSKEGSELRKTRGGLVMWWAAT